MRGKAKTLNVFRGRLYLSDEKNQATPARETVEVIKAIIQFFQRKYL